jgi:hypothetical protein
LDYGQRFSVQADASLSNAEQRDQLYAALEK